MRNGGRKKRLCKYRWICPSDRPIVSDVIAFPPVILIDSWSAVFVSYVDLATCINYRIPNANSSAKKRTYCSTNSLCNRHSLFSQMTTFTKWFLIMCSCPMPNRSLKYGPLVFHVLALHTRTQIGRNSTHD